MKSVTAILFACAVMMLSACDKPTTPDAGPPVLRVGATPEGFPHYFRQNGKNQGYSVEILQAVADKIHYKVEWVISDWVGVLGALETGKIDTVGNFADTPERRKKYIYSVPYHYSAAALAVSQNNVSIHGLSDMAGKSVAAQLGANYAKVLKEYDPDNKIRLVTFEGLDVIVNSVAQGKIDAYVSGEVILRGQIKKKHLPLKVVGDAFGEKQVALPFRKTARGEALKAKVDRALTELRADGTLRRISEKWFDRDLSVSHQPEKKSPSDEDKSSVLRSD